MGDDNIVRVSCATDGCGTFPMDKALHNRLKKSGDTFTCPAGHQQHFSGEEDLVQKLKNRISELEGEVERYKERYEHFRESMHNWHDKYREAEDARMEVQKRILDGRDGVVEVREEAYMWACECGNTGRAEFDTRTDARSGYQQHRENAHDEAEAVTA